VLPPTIELRAELDGIAFDRSPDLLSALSIDASWRAQALSAAGRPMLADAVVSPRTAGEVARVLAVAAAAGVPVAPRAGGSGTRGGAVPNLGGLLVDLSLMDEILEFDESSGLVRVQPGVTGLRLEAWLNERGFMFPHYPTGAHMAQIGGYLAANGAGIMSTKYGGVERLVAAVEVALPTGEIVRTGGLPGYGPGPDLVRLFVGSEGTLGIITEATLQALPLPACRTFRALRFSDLGAAVDGVRSTLQAGWRPAAVRLLDSGASARNLSEALARDVDGVQLLLVFDGPEPRTLLEERRTVATLVAAGGIDEGPAPARSWWRNRFRTRQPAAPALWGTVDVAATYDRLVPVYVALRDLVRSEYGPFGARLDGDFPHWYPWGGALCGALVLERPPRELEEAIGLYDEVRRRMWETAVDLDAVPGGVRGIGLELARESAASNAGAVRLLRAIKAALDPGGIANPGKLGL